MQTKTLVTELIQGPAAFDQLAAEWDTLAQTGITDTPFQTLAYQKAWWQHLGEGDLYTIAIRDGATLVGILPLNVRDGVVFFNASMEETDYLDIIASSDDAALCWAEAISCICSNDFPAWNRCDFYNIPANSPSRDILTQLAADRGFSFASELAEVCPVIPLPETFDAYLAGLPKKQRHEIKRKMRRAKGADVELKIISAEDDLDQAVADFLRLLQSSTPEKNAWLNPGRTALFQDGTRAALATGTLQLLFLEVGGERAAALYNFIYKGRTWVYNSGLNTDGYSNLSLGVVVSAFAIQQAIELGLKEFDFLRGNETYKYRFGASDTEIFRVIIDK